MNEKSLQEILKENKERYNQRIKEQQEIIKKEQRKEFIIVIIASIMILGLTFKVMSDMNKKEINNCMEKGYSLKTCEYRLG